MSLNIYTVILKDIYFVVSIKIQSRHGIKNTRFNDNDTTLSKKFKKTVKNARKVRNKWVKNTKIIENTGTRTLVFKWTTSFLVNFYKLKISMGNRKLKIFKWKIKNFGWFGKIAILTIVTCTIRKNLFKSEVNDKNRYSSSNERIYHSLNRCIWQISIKWT